jgi:crotonobetainyl-CoA:carnitine CoA-transferase CaiB-like acyl-CoA transferase
LEEAKLPAAPMLTTAEVLGDPHVQQMGFLNRVEYPGAGEVPITGTPFDLSATPGTIRHRAPLLGEHTDEVLTEAGISPERIAELRATGAV